MDESRLLNEVRYIDYIKSLTFMEAKRCLTDLRVHQTAGYEYTYHIDYGTKVTYNKFTISELIELFKEVLNSLPNFGKHDRRKWQPIKDIF